MAQSNDLSETPNIRSRDAARTQALILKVAVQEFAEHGFHGARVGHIAQGAKCNARMLYHYFGSKEQLYVAALDSVYASIRNQEARLNLTDGDPLDAARQLVEFTFDYFARNATFVRMIRNENLLNGKYIRQSSKIPDMSRPLIASIDRMIDRGLESGAYRRRPDAVHLYLTIVALSAHHLNNAATLGTVVGQDLTDPAWQAARRAHAVDVVLSYLGARPT
ncbi:TetR/AcrR family transcriptional regulator [Jannaschia pohangensis]|uniref:Transcriptional regulator, TetR family n=1 Tax=Jannaschia pohangensis TaxID=390807 RepID=A0A1I3NXZ2_9RHOB|nr:TetR/AcrR family transcriptional regulator [Jannaschia pohangensis]SFJ14164.1 transcriptional regulator, TetR family [Jannaschia pohangensis]